MSAQNDAEKATFIGVDLAWKSEANPSGFAVLRGNRGEAEVEMIANPVRSLGEVLALINDCGADTVIVAVDAPLLMPNPTGSAIARDLWANAMVRGMRPATHRISRFIPTPQRCHSASRWNHVDSSTHRTRNLQLVVG